MRKWVVLGAGVLMALAGCGAATASPGSSQSSVGPLAVAEHSQCATVGTEVADYLNSGTADNPSDQATLDTDYAQERASIDAQAQSAQDGLIRAQADEAIQNCDAQLDAQASAAAAQAAAAASSAAAAQQSAQAAAAEAAVLAQEQDTCGHVGGTWATGVTDICAIDYKSPDDGQTYNYQVDFDASGNIIPESCADDYFGTHTACAGAQETVQQAKAGCLNGSATGVKSYWHADTDICSI